MKLFRVDADYENAAGELVGMLTYFSLAPRFDERSDVLIGWNRDWYEIDEPELTREQAAALVGRPWPTLPIGDLVALATYKVESTALAAEIPDEPIELAGSAAMQDAKQQLAAVVSRRDSKARVAWEKD